MNVIMVLVDCLLKVSNSGERRFRSVAQSTPKSALDDLRVRLNNQLFSRMRDTQFKKKAVQHSNVYKVFECQCYEFSPKNDLTNYFTNTNTAGKINSGTFLSYLISLVLISPHLRLQAINCE